jgi:hypothetical protein
MRPLERQDRVTRTLLELISFGDSSGAATTALNVSEWESLARVAVWHGAAPIVHARLSEQGNQCLAPAQVRRQLQGYFIRTGLENLRLYSRVTPLLQALWELSIGAIVLKGVFLAHTVYTKPALRSMGDADILVRPQDLQRVTQLLYAQGWHQSQHIETEPSRLGGHQLAVFTLDSTNVDIHWSIEDDGSPFLIDSDGLWERASDFRVGDVRALALSPEDLILHLCLHTAYSHGWLQFIGRLRAIYDIAATTSHYVGRIDWNVLVQRATTWGMSNCAWLALSLARDLLRGPIPERTVELLAPQDCDDRLVDTAVDLTLNDHYATLDNALPTLSRPWRTRRWYNLSAAARWRRLLLPGQNSVARAYPSLGAAALAPLRYLAYWADLARDGVRVSFANDCRALLSRERARMALGAWLEASARGPSIVDDASLSTISHHHDRLSS